MEDNKDIIAKSESVYDSETIKEFNKVHLRLQTSHIIVSIIAVLLMIYAIFAKDSDIYFRILTGVISILWFAEMLLLPYFWSRKYQKTAKALLDIKVEFNFYNNLIDIVSYKDDNKKGESEIEYTELYKVVDTKDNIYLYVSSNQAYICSKEKFSGDYNKISNIFKEKLNKKYIVKK